MVGKAGKAAAEAAAAAAGETPAAATGRQLSAASRAVGRKLPLEAEPAAFLTALERLAPAEPRR
ncbi:MAG TPA: hypothetical protein VFG43_17360 [Geminicoccaceae bacterium]|nr:hypothetical protein [Geminicoccaceae bacterium]